jgi:hypothetical protein
MADVGLPPISMRNTSAELVVVGRRLLTRPILVTLGAEAGMTPSTYTASWYETGLSAVSGKGPHEALEKLGRLIEVLLNRLEKEKLTEILPGISDDEAKRVSAVLAFYAYGPAAAMATLS